MLKFIPKLSNNDAPAIDNKYYVRKAKGGLNDGITINADSISTLPNCTSYAMGRFMEVQGLDKTKHPVLKDGGKIFPYTGDGYERGYVPQAGALICWDNPGQAGHVAFVEQVDADGSIHISQSGYRKGAIYDPTKVPKKYSIGQSHFWVDHIYPKNGKYVPSWTTKYIFQGFVYNPGMGESANISADQFNFVKTAIDSTGFDGEFIRQQFNLSTNQPWGTAYISYCLLQSAPQQYKIRTSSLTKLVSSLKANGALWIPGGNEQLLPQIGDIVLFRSKPSTKYNSVDSADDIAIITEMNPENKQISCTIGDSAIARNLVGVVVKEYKYTDRNIYGYLRIFENVYTPDVTLEVEPFIYNRSDAMVREIGYIDTRLNIPSINMGTIKWSVINVSAGMEVFAKAIPQFQAIVSSYKDVGSLDDSAISKVVDYYRRKGLTTSSSTALVGTLFYISGLNPAYSLNNKYGIAGWDDISTLTLRLGNEWSTNLSGQLDFVAENILTTDPKLYKLLKNANNILLEAQNLGNNELRSYFNIPKSINTHLKYIEDIWGKLQLMVTK